MANEEHLAILRQGVKIWNEWREKNKDIKPDLKWADLDAIDLSGVDLSGVDLSGANFSVAVLMWANLSRADLSGVDLTGANLTGANLSRADLSGANLSGVFLSGADLSKAIMFVTILANVDLSTVKGLNTIRHNGPSTIGIDTIYQSKGRIPHIFLIDTGVPKEAIDSLLPLAGKAIEFYSCFISHSSKDGAFAQRLYADLQAKDVRCWYAPEDMKIGDKIRPRIDESILHHDKLLLVLSKTSVSSQWVEQEVETALARERKEGRTVLFPIRLDNTITSIDGGWPLLIQNTRHIGDFTKWKRHDSYQGAFDRLLKDLKAEVP